MSVTNQSDKKRLNQMSYLINLILIFPVVYMGRIIGSIPEPYDEGTALVVFLARIISLTLVVFLIIWTVKRLHDFGRSGWFAFALLPPVTIFMLLAGIIVPSEKKSNKWGEVPTKLRVLGIKPNGALSLVSIMALVALILFIMISFSSFLSS